MCAEKSERAFGSEGRESYDERLNHILEAATERDRPGRLREGLDAGDRGERPGSASPGSTTISTARSECCFSSSSARFSSLLNNLREKLHGVDDPVEQLRVTVRAHVTYFASNMAALKVCSHELDSLTGPAYEETRRIRREYYEMARSIVDRVIVGSGEAQDILDARVATMSLFGTLNWLYRWYDPKKDRSPSGLANQISTQFLQGVLGRVGRSGRPGNRKGSFRRVPACG